MSQIDWVNKVEHTIFTYYSTKWRNNAIRAAKYNNSDLFIFTIIKLHNSVILINTTEQYYTSDKNNPDYIKYYKHTNYR